MGWKPIATAPKDGTQFIGRVKEFHPSVAWWDEKHGWMNDRWGGQRELADVDEMYTPTIEGPWELTDSIPLLPHD